MDQRLESTEAPEGTAVKIGWNPFELVAPAPGFGRAVNQQLSMSQVRTVSKSKKQLQEAVLAHLEMRGGPLRSNESGVTRLKALGLSHGSAQRVLDDYSDVRLETLAQLAAGLKVQLWELLMPAKDITPAALSSPPSAP